MVWLYENAPVDDELVENYVGFVYIIVNRINGMKYIGKKLFTKAKTKVVKGKKKRTRVASDWKNYFGSNATLLEDVKLHGEHNFHRKILAFCKTKSECSYLEAKYQFQYDVLLDETFYNSWIMVRVRKSQLSSLTKPTGHLII